MIFQHTLQQVLDRTKTQTARKWKDYYRIGDYRFPYETRYQLHGHGNFFTLWSVNSGRPRIVYSFGGAYSVQPGRGQKSVGLIRIQKLWKQDVREYTDHDIKKEGFNSFGFFISVWIGMHDPVSGKLPAPVADDVAMREWALGLGKSECYTALCIEFELLESTPPDTSQ